MYFWHLSKLVKITNNQNVLVSNGAYKQNIYILGNSYTGSSPDTIEIQHDISRPTFERIYDFLYSGQIEITMDNIEEILRANKDYKIDSLDKACQEAVLKFLNKHTCLRLNSLAG